MISSLHAIFVLVQPKPQTQFDQLKAKPPTDHLSLIAVHTCAHFPSDDPTGAIAAEHWPALNGRRSIALRKTGRHASAIRLPCNSCWQIKQRWAVRRPYDRPSAVRAASVCRCCHLRSCAYGRTQRRSQGIGFRHVRSPRERQRDISGDWRHGVYVQGPGA